jgi:hypothetical protein
VIPATALPESWVRWGGIDWGHRAPSAVVKAAIDGDGRVWVYWELYQSEIGEKGLAEAILASGPEHIVYAFDPAMSAKLGDAKPVAAILKEEGVRLVKANNDRLSGWQRVHTYLAEGPACPIHRAKGQLTCPMLHVFENCIELIRTLPAVPYNTIGNPEDVDTHSEDHLPDALRYMLMQLGTLVRPFLYEYSENLGISPASPVRSHAPGLTVAGDFKSDLDFGQEENGKVKPSPYAMN